MTAIDTNTHGPDGHDHHAGDGHGHGHSQYPFLAHHFDTPAQQFDSAKLGMWVFLATEILFFGALFALYAIMRYREPEVFSHASHYLSTTMGAINTVVLILSSLTMAMGVHFAQRGKRGPLVVCLLLTLAGAAGFLVIKYFEYEHKIHAGLVWGKGFYEPVKDEHGNIIGAPAESAAATTAPAAAPGVFVHPLLGKPIPAEASTVKKAAIGPSGIVASAENSEATKQGFDGVARDIEEAEVHDHDADKAHVFDPKMPVNTHRFFAIYYAMTGLHGIHVVIGIFLIGWLAIRSFRGDFTGNYYTPVDLVGLYWHIVDLIWIFLFPLFYLIH